MIEDLSLLWRDSDRSRTLRQKIDRAVAYYVEKYGKSPLVCLVNPTMLDGSQFDAGLQVVATKTVKPDHLWLGGA